MNLYNNENGFTPLETLRQKTPRGRNKEFLTGFTIIETIVVAAIILILSSILLPNYKAFSAQFALARSAHKLVQDIRRAQEMATSARELGGVIPSGYGAYLITDQTDYIIYADTSPAGGDRQYMPGQDTLMETIDLENGVYIQSVSPSPVSINFGGPDPLTTISGGGNSVTIVLSLESDIAKLKNVIVNNVGLIYVE